MPLSPNPRLPRYAAAIYLVLPVLSSSELFAAECLHQLGSNRPRIGLALGGGGARGAAHIGVLRKLEELQVPVDYIAGTSMGAIIGGFYATGMDVGEIEKILIEADWEDLLIDAAERRDQPLRRKAEDNLGLDGPKLGIGASSKLLPGGAVAGQKVSLLLENVISQRTREQNFDQLPIPFRAVAADIVSGNMVILDQGQLSLALRSSMSVPGAFDPVRYGDALLIDGGIVRNLPVDVVRDMGADIIIAVDVMSPKLQAGELVDLISIVNQLTTLMVAGNTEEQIKSMHEHDVLIKLGLGTEFGSANFQHMANMIAPGYEAAALANTQLSAMSLNAEQYQDWRRNVQGCISGLPEIHFVRLENNSRFSDEIIEKMITVKTGGPLDVNQLEHDIRQIHALGFIRHVRHQVIEEAGRHGVLIRIEPDPRGTEFIETGLKIEGNSRGSSIALKAGYLKTDLDRRGSEFRAAVQLGNEQGALADFYLHVDDKRRWVFNPRIRGSRRDLTLFDDSGYVLEEWELTEYSAELAFGREFGRHTSIFLSASNYTGNTEIQVGDPLQDNFRFNGGEWTLAAEFDRLDNRYLPSSGSFARLNYIVSDKSLGADAEFKQLELSFFSAVTRGRHTAWFGAQFNTTLDNDAPLYGLFSGGGFLNMSGFERNQLFGQHFGFALIGYRFELGRTGILPAYAGLTLEYGNAAERSGDVFGDGILNGSFYLGYDSPLGPLYLGMGWSEDQRGLLFLRLGLPLGGQSIGRR